jgi:hypothetical protein
MRGLALFLTAATTIACGDTGVEGGSGEWLRGRSLSVRMMSTGTDDGVEIRNDSDHDVSMAPFRIKLGDHEYMDLVPEDEQSAFLEPGESFTFSIAAAPDVDQVLIEIGAGADREVFTVTRGS